MASKVIKSTHTVVGIAVATVAVGIGSATQAAAAGDSVQWPTFGQNVGKAASTNSAISTSNTNTVAAAQPTVDVAAGARFKAVFDAARSAAGWGPYFTGAALQHAAQANAAHLATGASLTDFPRGTDMGTGATMLSAPDAVGAAAATLASQLLDGSAVLRTHVERLFVTDGGFAVVLTPHDADAVRVTVWVQLGIGPLARPRSSGCSDTAGYCWFGWGLNRHMPTLRNRIGWRVSAGGATAYRIDVVKRAIAMMNAVGGLGADLVYAGTTSHTAPTLRQPFIVRWMNTGTHCINPAAPGCTAPRTYLGQYTGGTVKLLNGAIRQNRTHRARWVAVVAHEIGHALGLAHYDKPYDGRLQLMNGQQDAALSPRSGDRHGMQQMAPPGVLRARLSLDSTQVPAAGTVTATVTASSSGFGGVRRVQLQCTSPTGSYVTRAERSGVFDILRRDYRLTWTVDAASSAYTASCRAVVTSKAARVATAAVAVAVGG
jgi:hypothetical protein